MTVLFEEKQRLHGPVRRLCLMVFVGPLLLVGLVTMIGSGMSLDDLRQWIVILGAAIVPLFVLLGVFLSMYVVVTVTDDRVRVRARPFVRSEVPLSSIREVEVVPFGLRDRFGAGFGRQWLARIARYSPGNDAGVVLGQAGSWQIVLGSRRPAELADAIRSAMSTASPVPRP